LPTQNWLLKNSWAQASPPTRQTCFTPILLNQLKSSYHHTSHPNFRRKVFQRSYP
jgi:hypothetical protein